MALKETVASQAQRIQLLEELVHALKHRQFGASSEKASPQQNLFNEAEADEVSEYADDKEKASDSDADDTITVASHTRCQKDPSDYREPY